MATTVGARTGGRPHYDARRRLLVKAALLAQRGRRYLREPPRLHARRAHDPLLRHGLSDPASLGRSPLPRWLALFRRHVGAGDAAFDHERRRRHVRRLVRREEQGRGGDLAGVREPAHRHVDQPRAACAGCARRARAVRACRPGRDRTRSHARRGVRTRRRARATGTGPRPWRPCRSPIARYRSRVHSSCALRAIGGKRPVRRRSPRPRPEGVLPAGCRADRRWSRRCSSDAARRRMSG
jgi:hypothetical protein